MFDNAPDFSKGDFRTNPSCVTMGNLLIDVEVKVSPLEGFVFRIVLVELTKGILQKSTRISGT